MIQGWVEDEKWTMDEARLGVGWGTGFVARSEAGSEGGLRAGSGMGIE